MSDEARRLTWRCTGRSPAGRFEDNGCRHEWTTDIPAGHVWTRPPGCPSCQERTYVDLIYELPTHDDAESEAERVETWTIVRSSSEQYPADAVLHEHEARRRDWYEAHPDTFELVEAAPLTALTQERQRREEAEELVADIRHAHQAAEKEAADLERQLHEARTQVEELEEQRDYWKHRATVTLPADLEAEAEHGNGWHRVLRRVLRAIEDHRASRDKDRDKKLYDAVRRSSLPTSPNTPETE